MGEWIDRYNGRVTWAQDWWRYLLDSYNTLYWIDAGQKKEDGQSAKPGDAWWAYESLRFIADRLYSVQDAFWKSRPGVDSWRGPAAAAFTRMFDGVGLQMDALSASALSYSKAALETGNTLIREQVDYNRIVDSGNNQLEAAAGRYLRDMLRLAYEIEQLDKDIKSNRGAYLEGDPASPVPDLQAERNTKISEYGSLDAKYGDDFRQLYTMASGEFDRGVNRMVADYGQFRTELHPPPEPEFDKYPRDTTADKNKTPDPLKVDLNLGDIKPPKFEAPVFKPPKFEAPDFSGLNNAIGKLGDIGPPNGPPDFSKMPPDLSKTQTGGGPGAPQVPPPMDLPPPNLAPPNLAPPNLAPPNLAPPNLAPPPSAADLLGPGSLDGPPRQGGRSGLLNPDAPGTAGGLVGAGGLGPGGLGGVPFDLARAAPNAKLVKGRDGRQGYDLDGDRVPDVAPDGMALPGGSAPPGSRLVTDANGVTGFDINNDGVPDLGLHGEALPGGSVPAGARFAQGPDGARGLDITGDGIPDVNLRGQPLPNSTFFQPPPASGPGQGPPPAGGPADRPFGRAVNGLNPADQVGGQPVGGGGAAGGLSGALSDVTTPVFQPASGGGGMGGAGASGMGGGGAGQGTERERQTPLSEDDEVWRDEKLEAATAVLGRPADDDEEEDGGAPDPWVVRPRTPAGRGRGRLRPSSWPQTGSRH